MLGYLCHRRRRWLVYKLLGALVFLLLLLSWAKQERSLGRRRERFSDDSYEKAEQPLHDEEEKALLPPQNGLKQQVQEQMLQVVGPGKELDVLPKPDGPEVDRVEKPDNSEFAVPNRYHEEEDGARYEREIAEDTQKVVAGLGEGGDPVHLKGEDEKKAEELMKKEAFNILLSDRISLTRAVPDTRDTMCRDLTYDATLPQASVIIIFTNEAWSPLIRTIYSVLNRSPPKFLKEIILVDDFSDRVELKGKLDYFVRTRLPRKVRILRLKERNGLIRARLQGAKTATGDVMVFLDSHCEANEQWLEPLLQRIKEKPNTILVPIIDVIDDKTLEYYHGNGRYFQVGGFSWSGHFTWIDISEAEEKRRGSQVGATRSPTMAGGLFAVDRQYFWDVGSYDSGMDVWGGENLEMAFRVWQCGGTLETIPCSRVGHIFRSFHPYTFPGNKDTHGINTVRMVEVWMDDYKRLFYLHRPDMQTINYGSVADRIQFRKDKKCKSFDWYLQNVYPQKFILDTGSEWYGRLANPSSALCLDTLGLEDADEKFYPGVTDCKDYMGPEQVRNNVSLPSLCLDNLQRDEKRNFDLGVYMCHNQMFSSQFFSLSWNGELRREDVCAEVPAYFIKPSEKVVMAKCHGRKGNQEWVYQNQQLIHKPTGKCLDATGLTSNENVLVATCNEGVGQRWSFDHHNAKA